jgi:peptide deformylase
MIITDKQLLRRPCQEVMPEEVGILIATLEDELSRANRLGARGIGLAAPQIGILKKIAIVRLGEVYLNLVNAQIAHQYDPITFKEEGCLSVPNRLEDTTRFQEVHLIDNLVYPNALIATGMLSVVCQHELDHLNGILFLDRKVVKSSIVSHRKKPRPNEPCCCGSNRKYKKCCGKELQ